jgi:DNA-binding transcriptional LysR family regulator
LVALDALLTERNVTRAAERLFVTQQAMSASLGRLREHFDDELLIRVGREMMTTPMAEALARPVREALLSAERALTAEPHFNPATANRRFRVSLSDYASFVVLPRLLQLVTSVAPGIVIEVEPLAPNLPSRIANGEIAFSITTSDFSSFGVSRPSDALILEPLFTDDFVCVVDRNHPLIQDGISRGQYEQASHNLAQFGRPTETSVEKAWRHEGIAPVVGAVAPGFVAILFMLPGTPLVGTVQRRLAEAVAPKLGLRTYECPIPVASLNEDLVWHERDRMDPAHAFLRKLCHEAVVQAAP